MLSRVLRRLTWMALASAACFLLPAAATSGPPGPTLSTWVSFDNSTVLNVSSTNVGPYTFGGIVTWPENTPVYANGADVYFGVLMPGGTSVYSWTTQNGVATLVPGYVPFARAISNKTTFQPFANNAQLPVTYSLNGTEAKGLYFVFLILMSPGADPNDSRQWGQVSTQPFFVK